MIIDIPVLFNLVKKVVCLHFYVALTWYISDGKIVGSL